MNQLLLSLLWPSSSPPSQTIRRAILSLFFFFLFFPPFSPGALLGQRYEVLQRLGEGGIFSFFFFFPFSFGSGGNRPSLTRFKKEPLFPLLMKRWHEVNHQFLELLSFFSSFLFIRRHYAANLPRAGRRAQSIFPFFPSSLYFFFYLEWKAFLSPFPSPFSLYFPEKEMGHQGNGNRVPPFSFPSSLSRTLPTRVEPAC